MYAQNSAYNVRTHYYNFYYYYFFIFLFFKPSEKISDDG